SAYIFIKAVELAFLKFKVVFHKCLYSDEVITARRRLVDAQPFEEFGRHPFAPFGPGSERLPEQDIGVLLGGDALAELVVDGGLIMDVPLLIERASDIGRLLAERKLRCRFAVRCNQREQKKWSDQVHGPPPKETKG